jgi:hypothetical protein
MSESEFYYPDEGLPNTPVHGFSTSLNSCCNYLSEFGKKLNKLFTVNKGLSVLKKYFSSVSEASLNLRSQYWVTIYGRHACSIKNNFVLQVKHNCNLKITDSRLVHLSQVF